VLAELPTADRSQVEGKLQILALDSAVGSQAVQNFYAETRLSAEAWQELLDALRATPATAPELKEAITQEGNSAASERCYPKMPTMSGPRIDQQGSLDLASFARLSYEELRLWVSDRLHGRDLALPSSRDDADMPHLLVALVYPSLGRSTRKDLQAIVIEFLRDLARNPETRWLGAAGSELLMLADPVLLDAGGRAEIAGDLRKIVDSRRTTGAGEPDLQFRALQALVTLRHRANNRYWIRQYEIGGDVYLPVVLEGLSLIDISAPIDWLRELDWNDAVERAIIGLLPSLLEEYSAGVISKVLSEALPDLPEAGRDSLLQFCKEEQLTLETSRTRAMTSGRGLAYRNVEGPTASEDEPRSAFASVSDYLQHVLQPNAYGIAGLPRVRTIDFRDDTNLPHSALKKLFDLSSVAMKPSTASAEDAGRRRLEQGYPTWAPVTPSRDRAA